MKFLLIQLILLTLTVPAYAVIEPTLEQRIDDLTNRIEVLEALPQSIVTGFVGHGNAQTMPFTITESPWTITWSAELTAVGSARLSIFVCDLRKDESIAIVHGYGFWVSGNQSGSTVTYIQPGTYYFRVDTHGQTNWRIGYK